MNRRLVSALLVVALLTACSATIDPPPALAPSSSSPATVQPLVGESSSEEGWVGDDEIPDDTTAVAGEGDAHPNDPPSNEELEAAVTTANEVIVGWLTADQTRRRDALSPVAAEALIDAFDDARFIPVAGKQLGPTHVVEACLLYTSPSPRDKRQSRMPSSA